MWRRKGGGGSREGKGEGEEEVFVEDEGRWGRGPKDTGGKTELQKTNNKRKKEKELKKAG